VTPIRLALVGLGKIARDRHLPALAADRDFSLAATVDPVAPGLPGTPHFDSLAALLANGTAFDAAVICSPPQVRAALALTVLAQGRHVLLEKPPAATLGEVEILRQQADRSGTTLLAAWHSRFAAGVAPAREWLAGRRIDRVRVVWREDVRVWHPGQDWIWQPGGFGVFDPGINALSIMTHILPHPFCVTEARLRFPQNKAAPIAADLTFRDTSGAEILMDLDFRQTGPQRWDIVVETDAGTLALAAGGAVLTLPSGSGPARSPEYPNLYRHFAQLIRAGCGDVDAGPLRLVADAFLIGQSLTVDPFD
jgi:D-galactose 1-dehydrogenase